MILMPLLKHAIITHKFLILSAKVSKLHIVMNRAQQPRRVQVKFSLIIDLYRFNLLFLQYQKLVHILIHIFIKLVNLIIICYLERARGRYLREI
jgi:hypothetical protein